MIYILIQTLFKTTSKSNMEGVYCNVLQGCCWSMRGKELAGFKPRVGGRVSDRRSGRKGWWIAAACRLRWQRHAGRLSGEPATMVVSHGARTSCEPQPSARGRMPVVDWLRHTGRMRLAAASWSLACAGMWATGYSSFCVAPCVNVMGKVQRWVLRVQGYRRRPWMHGSVLLAGCLLAGCMVTCSCLSLTLVEIVISLFASIQICHRCQLPCWWRIGGWNLNFMCMHCSSTYECMCSEYMYFEYNSICII
jgi:hypothetical protein